MGTGGGGPSAAIVDSDSPGHTSGLDAQQQNSSSPGGMARAHSEKSPVRSVRSRRQSQRLNAGSPVSGLGVCHGSPMGSEPLSPPVGHTLSSPGAYDWWRQPGEVEGLSSAGFLPPPPGAHCSSAQFLSPPPGARCSSARLLTPVPGTHCSSAEVLTWLWTPQGGDSDQPVTVEAPVTVEGPAVGRIGAAATELPGWNGAKNGAPPIPDNAPAASATPPSPESVSAAGGTPKSPDSRPAGGGFNTPNASPGGSPRSLGTAATTVSVNSTAISDHPAVVPAGAAVVFLEAEAASDTQKSKKIDVKAPGDMSFEAWYAKGPPCSEPPDKTDHQAPSAPDGVKPPKEVSFNGWCGERQSPSAQGRGGREGEEKCKVAGKGVREREQKGKRAVSLSPATPTRGRERRTTNWQRSPEPSPAGSGREGRGFMTSGKKKLQHLAERGCPDDLAEGFRTSDASTGDILRLDEGFGDLGKKPRDPEPLLVPGPSGVPGAMPAVIREERQLATSVRGGLTSLSLKPGAKNLKVMPAGERVSEPRYPLLEKGGPKSPKAMPAGTRLSAEPREPLLQKEGTKSPGQASALQRKSPECQKSPSLDTAGQWQASALGSSRLKLKLESSAPKQEPGALETQGTSSSLSRRAGQMDGYVGKPRGTARPMRSRGYMSQEMKPLGQQTRLSKKQSLMVKSRSEEAKSRPEIAKLGTAVVKAASDKAKSGARMASRLVPRSLSEYLGRKAVLRTMSRAHAEQEKLKQIQEQMSPGAYLFPSREAWVGTACLDETLEASKGVLAEGQLWPLAWTGDKGGALCHLSEAVTSGGSEPSWDSDEDDSDGGPHLISLDSSLRRTRSGSGSGSQFGSESGSRLGAEPGAGPGPAPAGVETPAEAVVEFSLAGIVADGMTSPLGQKVTQEECGMPQPARLGTAQPLRSLKGSTEEPVLGALEMSASRKNASALPDAQKGAGAARVDFSFNLGRPAQEEESAVFGKRPTAVGSEQDSQGEVAGQGSHRKEVGKGSQPPGSPSARPPGTPGSPIGSPRRAVPAEETEQWFRDALLDAGVGFFAFDKKTLIFLKCCPLFPLKLGWPSPEHLLGKHLGTVLAESELDNLQCFMESPAQNPKPVSFTHKDLSCVHALLLFKPNYPTVRMSLEVIGTLVLYT